MNGSKTLFFTGVTDWSPQSHNAMDFKEIAKKVIEGANADELTTTLSDKDKSEVWKEVAVGRKKIADDELAVIEARRQARKQIEQDEAGTRAKAEDTVRGQMRSEQIDIALNIAESKLQAKGIKLTPEAKLKLKEDFRPFDSGKYDATLIVSDLLKAYAATNAEKLIDDAGQRAVYEQNAAMFTSGAASAAFTGAGTPGEPEMSPEVRDTMREAQKQGISLTKEQAERGLNSRGWKKVEAVAKKS